MINPAQGQTFQHYLDNRIADRTEDNPDLDIDDLQDQFLKVLSQYGFDLTDVIPGTFDDILAKHVL